MDGWWYPEEAGASGLAFYSGRRTRAYAHVHMDPGDRGIERALRLLQALVRGFPPGVRRADVGLSGLPEAEEAELGRRAIAALGGMVLVRRCLERSLGPEDDADPPMPVAGGRTVPARSISLEVLARLDWRAFRGTPDEALVADTFDEDLRGLAELLDNRLGRFLEPASDALVLGDDQVTGALLAAEHDPRVAIVLDLVVEPSERRHGVATFLLRRSFRALRALGYQSARLWVTESNAPAFSLYGRLGFRPVATARIYRWADPAADSPHRQTAR